LIPVSGANRIPRRVGSGEPARITRFPLRWRFEVAPASGTQGRAAEFLQGESMLKRVVVHILLWGTLMALGACASRPAQWQSSASDEPHVRHLRGIESQIGDI